MIHSIIQTAPYEHKFDEKMSNVFLCIQEKITNWIDEQLLMANATRSNGSYSIFYGFTYAAHFE